ncbi:MAG TPA: glycosyltransferase [Candidatus Dormibacteraeota bacterium]|nr:glycosyltransferase [Candidatus Dormibacteraeota bacterium]
MLSDVLFVPVLVAYVLILVALAAFGVNFFCLIAVALRTRRDGRVATPHSWPAVTVQLPVYNELYVARRLIDAVAAMEYPAGLLEIQVLDDSTDETSHLVAEAVSRWRRQSVDIQHIHRPDRQGFKAGALRHGMSRARGELLAILDADFLPQPDFLVALVPRLVADPGLAFVQACWGHVNRDSSLLTRLQALAIDGHFAIEQTARCAGGLWFNFNGTAGIWRKAALESAGGWRDDTLTEDLDVSYRAFLAGWRAAYADDVVVPAELPVSYSAYRRQQHRWARGSFECAAKHLPAVWRSSAPLGLKAEATLHLSGYGIHLLMLALTALYPLILVVSQGRHQLLQLLGAMGVFNLTTVAPTLLFTVAQRRLHRPWLRQLPTILLLSVFGSGLMVNTARAAWQAMRGTRGVFERTPKFAVRERKERWQRKRYQIAADRIIAVEAVVMGLNLLTVAAAVRMQVWAIAVYAAVFAAGLGCSVLVTVVQDRRATLPRRRPRAQPAGLPAAGATIERHSSPFTADA